MQANAKPHTAAITTACLRSRRVRVLNWPACSPGARSGSGAQRFATVSGLNDMFPGNVQRGLRYVFSCLVGVSEMSAQSAATCI